MFKQMKLSGKLASVIGVMILGMIVFSGFGWWVMNRVKINGPLYQQLVNGKDLIADILPPPEYIIETYLVSLPAGWQREVWDIRNPALLVANQYILKLTDFLAGS